ncbi:MAG: STAS domain-containing protein [Clostridia bacterium]|nr:STAS domain-containing protein [Clostridia bacterium]
MLNIKKTVENGKAAFALEGRLDTVTAPDLEKEIMGSIDGVNELTLDFAGLDYISSAGLRVLLATQKIMNGRGGMTVSNVTGSIMDIFEVTGFSEILTIVQAE